MKNTYKYIIFDLDGTLMNSAPGITKSAQYALKKFNIDVEDETTLTFFIGPPLVYSFQKFYGFSEEDAIKGRDYYREYYKDKGIFDESPYDGIVELLDNLKKNGFKLYVATYKPQYFAELILKHFNLDVYFDKICGVQMHGLDDSKSDLINSIIAENKEANLNEFIMFGDRENDILAAKTSKIASIGVSYGFGSVEELQNAGADYIISSPQAIFEMLTK